MNETATPTAPAGYAWGAATYANPAGTINAAASGTITNPLNRQSAQLILQKTWAANSIAGDQTTVTTDTFANNASSGASTALAAGNTTAGAAVTVYVGESANISETGFPNLSNYTQSWSCTGGGSLSGNKITIAAADVGKTITCTESNTRKTKTLTVAKTWSAGALAGDTATVSVPASLGSATSGSSVATAAGNTTTGTGVTVSAGASGALSEAFTVGSGLNYTASYSCTAGATVDASGTVTIDATAASPTCTITNTRKTKTLTVAKTWSAGALAGDTATVSVPASLGSATSGSSVATAAGNTTTGTGVTVSAGASGALSEAFTVGSGLNYTASYSCTAGATVDASGTVTIDATAASPTCTITNTLIPKPALTIVKSAGKPTVNKGASNTLTDAGDTIAYSFVVTNTGNTPLIAVVVNDTQLDAAANCPATMLAVGVSMTCTGTHTITQAEVNAGKSDNSATAGGTPPNGTPVLSPPSTTTTPIALTPVMTLKKTADKATYSVVGDVITYTYTLTNMGNVAINGLSVTDDKLGTVGNCTPANLAPSGQGTSVATCSATHTVTQSDLTAGSITNVATGHGTPVGGMLVPPTATLTVTAKPNPIVAKDDSYPNISGATGATTASVIVNDTLNGATLTTGDIGAKVALTPGTAPTTTSGGIVMNPDGTITVKQGTPAGTYTYPYTICEKLNPNNCSTATATVVVNAAPIVAIPDVYTGINGATGNPNAGNAYGNDTLGGQPVDPAKIVGTVVTPATPINGGPVPSLDPVTGAVSVPSGTPAGDYQISYKICEKLNPSNCSTTTIDVKVVAAAIKAIDDDHSSDPINGGNGGNTPTVLGNDTLNGQPVSATTVTLTPGASPNPGLVMNPDGTITVKPGTPAGTYAYPYTICEKLNPANCSTATATVKVTAPVIIATPDTPPAIDSTTGGNTPSVLINDTINGQPATTGNVVLTPGNSPNSGLVMNPDGTITVKPGTLAGTYTYPYTICDRINPTNCANATATVVVTAPASMRVTKTAQPSNVHVGDLVRYTLTIENTGSVPVNAATLIDTPPAGFSYVDKSMTIVDRDNKANMIATRTLIVSGIDIDVGQRAVVTYMLRVGAGIHPGTYTNQALMQDRGRDASNIATADVQVVGDPMTDDTLIVGTVFDDRDGDGWQDSATASGLKAQGGFSPAAYVSNSTTVDRGDGPKPEADHSSPMLHGIPLGELKGRQSDADPVAKHQIVIRQHLRELAFNDDFVLTSKEGVTVRMDAAGKTRVETSGDAAKGLNAVDLKVERKIAQVEDGYQVDYVISNAGVDERGIPGVRIASVEGLLIETDQFGRYHLAAIPGGPDTRGRNFILKVDPSTLPPGTTFTTDNPLVRRVTPGLPVRFDFGVKLPSGVIEGATELYEMELGKMMFDPGSARLHERYAPVVRNIADEIRGHGGGEVVIAAQGEDELLAFDRAVAVRKALIAALPVEIAAKTRVSLRTNPADARSTVVGLLQWPQIGNVLFDTNKSTIKPEFAPLIARIADYLVQSETKRVVISGHADPRASDAYNDALGMRRAKAVFDAITAQLPESKRKGVQVEFESGPSSSSGQHNAQEGRP
ncbi:DUF7507 domain-containing protein [Solilutibacter silvestris]|uniref:DUF7507 domain-containing protein n=1 Tax=Solilutibacter silvestris TaxID=1645665 RepID=UPI0013FD108A|nr:OmpA family protein [Lysobacter silvestris]